MIQQTAFQCPQCNRNDSETSFEFVRLLNATTVVLKCTLCCTEFQRFAGINTHGKTETMVAPPQALRS